MRKVPARLQNLLIKGMQTVRFPLINYLQIYLRAGVLLRDVGKDGAPPAEGIGGVVEDVKKAASDAVKKGGL